jgi:hypothetical protein
MVYFHVAACAGNMRSIDMPLTGSGTGAGGSVNGGIANPTTRNLTGNRETLECGSNILALSHRAPDVVEAKQRKHARSLGIA